ncbi:MAG: GLUG motif-containing protein, partial [Anaerolineales bacterium]|nr:GLUG motif-containing protein [Anaerolineales bacterium]
MRSRIFIPLILFSVLQGQTTVTAPSGSGTSGDPYLIANLGNLSWISQNSGEWGKYFDQTANIDASGTQYWDDADDNFDGDKYNDTNDGSNTGNDEGFSPFGNNTTQFNGIYDGQNYTIDGLYINRSSTNYIGLFGYTTHITHNISGATIQNLGLTNVQITGNNHVGGLVGNLNHKSNVTNCYTTGTVIGTGENIGGLVGYIYYHSGVSQSYSSASVNGTNNVGGLVGTSTYVTGISNSFSSGSINGSGNNVGGLVGNNTTNADISKCYSTSSVTGSSSVGGLIGYINHSMSDITNNYSKGSVNGSGSSIGGLVGTKYWDATVNNSSFWDIETSGQTTSDGGSGKTTAEMRTVYTFTNSNWDFEVETSNGTNNYWDIDNVNSTYNNGYPYLAWQDGETVNYVPDLTAPTTPTGLVATPGNTQLVLTWTANTESDLASYKVYVGTSSNPTYLISTVTSGQTYTHSSLTNGTLYYYRISAVDNAGNESDKTSDVFAMPHDTDGSYSLSFDGSDDYIDLGD